MKLLNCMVIDMTVPMWVYPILIWTVAWKAVAAWKAARKGHLIWFVVIFVVNTAGILPILYIFFFQNLKFSKFARKKGKKVSKKRVKKAPTL